MVRGKTRTLFQKLHLYLGLWCGLLFVLLGLTGSAIAWIHELDSMLNPDLFHGSVAGSPAADWPAPLTPRRVQEVVDRLSADPRYGRPRQLILPEDVAGVFVAWYRTPRAPSVFAQDISRQVMIDPATLRVLGERNWGEFGLSRRLLMPTLFSLHRYLVSGEAGKTIVGISGLLMFLLAVAGLLLWLPAPRRGAWRQAFRISYGGSWPRLHFTLHRTAGFFLAPFLMLQGFSGAYFNLPDWIVPVVGKVMTVSPPVKTASRAGGNGDTLSIAQAMAAAQDVFPGSRVSRIGIPAKPAAPFEIRLRQPGEIRQGDGATRISVDAYSGDILRVRDPLRAPVGDVFLNWLFPLHTGEAFGTAGRVATTCVGMFPLLFAITGLGIWLNRWRKAKTRAVR